MENKNKENEGHVFEMAMVTKSFDYYIDGSECDDNGVIIYEKMSGRLVKDNYTAIKDLHENQLYFNYDWIYKRFQYSRKRKVEDCKISVAKKYSLENETEHRRILGWSEVAKLKFNDVLSEHLGFTLLKYDLREVRIHINPNKNKGLTM